MSPLDEPVSPYPISVAVSVGVVEILDPCGEPSGPRIRLPDGAVTALNNDGGALNVLTEADHLAIAEAIDEAGA